jgi:hypothetical protein
MDGMAKTVKVSAVQGQVWISVLMAHLATEHAYARNIGILHKLLATAIATPFTLVVDMVSVLSTLMGPSLAVSVMRSGKVIYATIHTPPQ